MITRRLTPVVLLAAVGFIAGVGGKRCHTKLCRQEAHYLRQSMQLDVDPCSDFYTYACGNFVQHHPVPEPNLTLSSFEIADNATTVAIRSILSSPHEPTDSGALKKAKTMYTSCMDDASREEHGLHPLRRMLKDLGGWPLITSNWSNTSLDWVHVAKVMSQYGISLFFDVSVKPHPYNTSLNMIHIGPPGLPVAVPLQRPPPRRQETMDTLLFSPMTEEILQYLTDIALELCDHEGKTLRSDIEKELRQVIDLAKKLKEQHRTSILRSLLDRPLTVPISALDTLGHKIDWLQFLQAVFVRSGANVKAQHLVHVTGRKYLQSVLQLFNDTDSRVVANYIAACLVMYYAPDTTDQMFQYLTRLYHQLQVFPRSYPRWQYCVNKVLDYPDLGLSAALARSYLQDHNAFHLVAQLFDDIRSATVDLLEDNGWVDATVKSQVKTKMQAMSVMMGFPAWMLNNTQLDHFYDKLLIHSHDHFGNVVRMHSFMFAANLATLDSKDLKSKWPTSPFNANAFYEFQHNRIFLPVAIMQHPFYTGQDNITGRRVKPKMNQKKRKERPSTPVPQKRGRKRRQRRQSILLAVDYGRLGSVIGHETTHGFDDSGHLYDECGDMQFWSYNMEKTFDTRSACFTKQYGKTSGLFLLDSTLGEDISDNGGVRKAYTAFKKAWSRVRGANTTLPGLPRYTAEQLFFLSYATVWCYSGDEMSWDWHSKYKDRANRPLSNMKEFSAAWNCPAGSAMNPVDKCVLW